jgi:hypothetical protein
MQDLAYQLPRNPIPRTPVNKGMKGAEHQAKTGLPGKTASTQELLLYISVNDFC